MEDGNPIPPASKVEDVHADERPGGFVNLIVLDMDAYAEKYGEKAVRKLQDALVKMYQAQTHNFCSNNNQLSRITR